MGVVRVRVAQMLAPNEVLGSDDAASENDNDNSSTASSPTLSPVCRRRARPRPLSWSSASASSFDTVIVHDRNSHFEFTPSSRSCASDEAKDG